MSQSIPTREGKPTNVFAADITDRRLLMKYLCQDACYKVDREGNRITRPRRGPQKYYVDLVMCAECDSPCSYGLRYMRLTPEKELAEYTCGNACRQCTQPCNLYIPLMEKRRIKQEKRRGRIDTFIRTALREE